MSSPNKAPLADDELDQKIAEYVRLGLPLLIVTLVIFSGVFISASVALLVAAAGALVGIIIALWMSLRTLLGETPLSGADAYVFGAPPRVEEEQKRAILRALKDIEFERNVGKISEDDYQQLKAKYREEAKRLLQAIDEKSAAGRERAEVLVQKKLRQAGLLDGTAAANEKLDDADETNAVPEEDKPAFVQEPSEESAVAAVAMVLATKRPVKKKKKAKKKPAVENDESVSTNACGQCGTANDADAMFCKKCGNRVGKQDEEKEQVANDSSETGEEADAS